MKALILEGNGSQQQRMHMVQSLHSFYLLRTKLAIPPIHPMSIPRPHLIAKLNEGSNFKLTLISAPTGFGKTTLLSEWARQSVQPVIWISLSESDNDPAHFWTYLAIALASLSEHTDTRALELFPFDRQEAILAEITNFIAAIPQEFVLILDDYHTIQNPAIHAAFISLLEHLPLHMHIFIASRTRPPLPLPRLRAYRQFHELRPADLLFNLEEIKTFLTQILGRELLPRQVEIVKTQTEGWIAILHLIVIWLQEQKDDWQSLECIPCNHQYILEYLLEEVLQQQPQAVQSFLLQTSILTQFNSSLCDAITKNTDSHLLLEQVGQANLLLTTLSNQQNWYSYHRLFRIFLRERLTLTFPSQIPILHRRAYAWYEKQEMYVEAMTHALAIQDFGKSAEILLNYGELMLTRGDVSTLLTWLKELPEELVHQYPLLCLLYAWCLIMSGQFDAAEMWIRKTDYLDKRNSPTPETQKKLFLERKERDSKHIKVIASLLNAHIAIFWGNISRVTEFTLQEPTSLSGESNFIQNLNRLNVGVAKWLSGEINAAEEAFATVAASAKCQNNVYIMLAANCGMTITHMMMGKRHYAFSIAQQALQLITSHQNYLSPFSVYLYTETCYLLYEWNRLDEAAHYAHKALAYGHRNSQDICVYSYVILSRIKLAQGDLDEAYRFILLAEEGIPNSQRRPWISARMAEQSVDLALARKDLQRAEYWSQLPELKQFGSLAIILPMRVLLAKNKPRAALNLAQTALCDTDKESTDLLPIILQVRAYQKLGKMPRALQMLDGVLRRAEPEGYIRSFIDEGPPLDQMLRYQLTRYKEQDNQLHEESARLTRYVHLLLGEFAKETAKVVTPAEQVTESPISVSLFHELSERELDILQGITTGLSNQEIARNMVIAESTVKWHVKNIYSKLQVHNRAQAIIKAYKLHLV